MPEEEAKRKTVKMIENNKNIISKKIKKGLEATDYWYGYPISPVMFESLSPNQYIGMSEKVYNEIIRIRKITRDTEKEVTFFLIGSKDKKGNIFFEKIMINEENLKKNFGDFTPINKILKYDVNDILDEDIPTRDDLMLDHPYKQLVVCAGHTHSKNKYTDNFSFQDMNNIIKFKSNTEMFRTGQVEVLDVLINQAGDFNFLKYENNALFEGIFTYPNVFVKKDNNKLEKLPAYENGNYLYQEDLEKSKGQKK